MDKLEYAYKQTTKIYGRLKYMAEELVSEN
jgi:hypothetical protein